MHEIAELASDILVPFFSWNECDFTIICLNLSETAPHIHVFKSSKILYVTTYKYFRHTYYFDR